VLLGQKSTRSLSSVTDDATHFRRIAEDAVLSRRVVNFCSHFPSPLHFDKPSSTASSTLDTPSLLGSLHRGHLLIVCDEWNLTFLVAASGGITVRILD